LSIHYSFFGINSQFTVISPLASDSVANFHFVADFTSLPIALPELDTVTGPEADGLIAGAFGSTRRQILER
jgi:hypothetical protein